MTTYFHCIVGFTFFILPHSYFDHVHGASTPYLTKDEHKQYAKYLRTEILKKFPSDADDDAEVVTQENLDGVIYYKLASGDTKTPIFTTTGKENIGKNVVVLLRGEDYLSPVNKQRFVVLRKRNAGNEYNIHMAIIMQDINNRLTVEWQDVAIAMTPGATPLIELSNQPYLISRPSKLKAPKCGWVGDILMCESQTNLKHRGSSNSTKKFHNGKIPAPFPMPSRPPKKPKNPYWGISDSQKIRNKTSYPWTWLVPLVPPTFKPLPLNKPGPASTPIRKPFPFSPPVSKPTPRSPPTSKPGSLSSPTRPSKQAVLSAPTYKSDQLRSAPTKKPISTPQGRSNGLVVPIESSEENFIVHKGGKGKGTLIKSRKENKNVKLNKKTSKN